MATASPARRASERYTSAASTVPSVSAFSADRTSLTRVAVAGGGTAAAVSTAAVTVPQGSVSAHSATRMSGRLRSASRSTPLGLVGGMASTSWLRAKCAGGPIGPAAASGAGPSTASTSGAGPAAVRWASSESGANVSSIWSAG